MVLLQDLPVKALDKLAKEHNIVFTKKTNKEDKCTSLLNRLSVEEIDDFLAKQTNASIISQKDSLWENIIRWMKNEYGEELDGKILNSDDLKLVKVKYGGEKYEARLLCKIDSTKDIPTALKNLGLNLLSVSNGEYLLTRANVFMSLPITDDEPIDVIEDNESILLSMGESEKAYIDRLFYSTPNPIQEYSSHPLKYQNLLGGRHRMPAIKVLLGTAPSSAVSIDIESSQYETDSAYESKDTIIVIEAKTTKSTDFNLRQMYYPYRSIIEKMKKTGKEKKVIPLFINIQFPIITIYELHFTDNDRMDSAEIKSVKKYRLVH